MPVLQRPFGSDQEQAAQNQGQILRQVPLQCEGENFCFDSMQDDPFFHIVHNCMQDDLSTCRFIRSEEQYQQWAVKRREELAAVANYGEEDVNLWHEVRTLKKKVDILVLDVGDMKKKSLPILDVENKKEVEIRKWQIVVDFSIAGTLLVGLLIGIFCAIMWK